MDAHAPAGTTHGISASARALIVAVVLAALLGSVAPASASTIVGRNASAVKLEVSRSGEARVSYRAKGKQYRVLASGAINALPPVRGGMQRHFAIDYSGGFQSHYVKNPIVKAQLAKLRFLQAKMAKATAAKQQPAPLRACAPDQDDLPNPREDAEGRDELQRCVPALRRAEHSLARLRLHRARRQLLGAAVLAADAAQPRPDPVAVEPVGLGAAALPLVGSARGARDQSRLGQHPEGRAPLRATHVTSTRPCTASAPRTWAIRQTASVATSTWTRSTPRTAQGGRRENSFLAHNPGGNFCYGFYAHAPYPGYPAGLRPAGNGTRYRATVIGPGVLPDVGWEGTSIGSFDPADPTQVALRAAMNTLSDGSAPPTRSAGSTEPRHPRSRPPRSGAARCR